MQLPVSKLARHEYIDHLLTPFNTVFHDGRVVKHLFFVLKISKPKKSVRRPANAIFCEFLQENAKHPFPSTYFPIH